MKRLIQRIEEFHPLTLIVISLVVLAMGAIGTFLLEITNSGIKRVEERQELNRKREEAERNLAPKKDLPQRYFIPIFPKEIEIEDDEMPVAPQKHGATTEEQEMVAYAWVVSRGSWEFIATIEAESAWDAEATNTNRNGTTDHGICQLNTAYHGEFIASDEFKSWQSQIRYCWAVFQNRPQDFYGYAKRKEMKKRFAWPMEIALRKSPAYLE